MARLLSLPLLALLSAPAYADDTCDVSPPDEDGITYIDVSAAEGVCTADLADDATLSSETSATAQTCSWSRIGNNVIVVWPLSKHEDCTAAIGNNVVVVWP